MADTPTRGTLAIRVTLVLVLLGLAANALSSRRDLDWAAISEAPESAWTGLVLLGLGTFAAVVAARTVVKVVRAAPPAGGEIGGVPRGRLPVLAYVAALPVIAATLVLVYIVLRSALAVPARFRDQGGTPVPGPLPAAGGGGNDTRALVLTVVIAAALGLGVSAVLRHRSAADEALDEDDAFGQGPRRAALTGAVAAAEEQLDSHGDDTRAAIIAAYLAMERALVTGGTTRHTSDTPTDFLVRAVDSLHVSRPAVGRLTDLFREARFSTHPMPPRAREDAARALARVAEDLTHAPR